MAMASLTSSLLARKGQARPSSHNPVSDFRFENDDAVELLLDAHREEAARGTTKHPAMQSVKKQPIMTDVSDVEGALEADGKVETTKMVSETKPAVKKRPALPPQNPEDVARKTVRIRSDLDVILRLFAARNNMSQKQIIEAALVDYLQEQRVDMSCICGADT